MKASKVTRGTSRSKARSTSRSRLSVAELKSRFTPQTMRMVMECGGNGRSFFQPPARGNQWTNGGAGCAEWTGVKLADVLKAAGLKESAKFTGHYGADPHLSGDTSKDAISRGMPIEKAIEPHTMIVWAMNGEPLPHIHGGPLRLIVPGWPGSLSSKWLTRVLVRKDPHDGQGMGGTSYRVPTVPIVPGSNVDGKTNFVDMTSMPTRSIITAPANGTRLPAGTRQMPIRGAAWAGDHEVQQVEVSFDAGQRWQAMQMAKPKNRYDWVRWTGTIALPSDGYFELWVARDRLARRRAAACGDELESARLWRKSVPPHCRAGGVSMRMSVRSLAAALRRPSLRHSIAQRRRSDRSTIEETPESLPDFKGREETFGYCIGCHSFRVVGRQGMDRARWDETLRFMTEKHNMPAPDDETRKLLLDYLAQAYPASSAAQTGGWVSPFAPTKYSSQNRFLACSRTDATNTLNLRSQSA